MTDVPLRTYVDARLDALDRRVGELDANGKLAVEKAATALNARLDTMNEFRGALNDLASRAATRDQLDALREKVSDIRITVAVVSALMSLAISIGVALITRLL